MAEYSNEICKCQRTDDPGGMTCQDNESSNENVNGTCYTDYGEFQIINTCGYKKPQHSCDGQDKNVKCSCHTSRGEFKITITCGHKRPQQKYMIRNGNCEENDKDNCEDESCEYEESRENCGESEENYGEKYEENKETDEENFQSLENDVILKKKAERYGMTCHDGKPLEEKSMYCNTNGKMEEFRPDNT